MRPKVQRRWYHRWLTWRSLKRATWILLAIGAASVAMFLLGSRSEKLAEKVSRHELIARQLRLKAEIAALLADADQRTDYVMAYHYSCNLLSDYDVVRLEESEAAKRVQERVRSCAYFSQAGPNRSEAQLEMFRHSANLRVQASKHAEVAAAYRRAIWNPWTVTQDVGVERDEPLRGMTKTR